MRGHISRDLAQDSQPHCLGSGLALGIASSMKASSYCGRRRGARCLEGVVGIGRFAHLVSLLQVH